MWRGTTHMNQHRLLASLVGSVAGFQLLTATVAAHSGTTHAGTPHWVLLALVVSGIGGMVGAIAAARRERLSVPVSGIAFGVSAAMAVFGGIGLVELQVVGRTAPQLVDMYPVLSLLVGSSVALGGILLVRLRYPGKPQYALLSLLLASWIAYPAVLPNGGYRNPLGYVLVLGLPLLVGYIIWTDARGLIQSLRLTTKPKLVGVAAGLLMSVFFAFSAGTMSFNPEQGLNAPTEAFVTTYDVAGPLVVWPAVEWFFPSIPFTGYLSVGTLMLMGILGGLVGLNAAIIVQQWAGRGSLPQKELSSGSVAVSGATACCCCAPAFYGVLSVVFGTAATPVYWAFMIPASPLGSTFFAASVVLLLSSILRATGNNATRASAAQTTPRSTGQ